MNVDNLNWTVEFYEENIKECNSLLNSLESYEKIPSINYVSLQNFSDGALVRYRGMVQDMLNPEYYSPFYTVVNTENNESYKKSGKFRDVSHCKANEEFKTSETEILPKERQVFFCIPSPGNNNWVEEYLKVQDEHTLNLAQSPGIKRKASNGDCETETHSEIMTNAASPTNLKKNKTNEGQEGERTCQNSIHNIANYFPFNKEIGLPCIVKVYEDEKDLNIVLNDVIEVIGFLSLNPALEANWEDADLADKVTHPPPSLVPRMHAILIKKLMHCNPLIKQTIPQGSVLEYAESARNDLHLLFTQLLFEDAIAADFLICHLISKVYVRNEGLTIGQFSLNFYNIKHKNFGSLLNNILKMLVTNSHYLPLSIEMLNDSCFIPKKDYESNRLCSGILQLCDNTHLILDEINMNEGQLNNQGCLNVLALQRLFRQQEVQYDFSYYPVTYNANIPLLVLSEGKSMFEADVKLNVKTDSFTDLSLMESYEAVRVYLNEEVANKLRIYLTWVRLLDFDFEEKMVKKIGEDYVSMRQQNEKFNSSDLHTLLVLSRLLALSHGRTILTAEDWSRAVEMEAERKLRSN